MNEKYFIYVSNKVKKSIKKIPRLWQERILSVLTALETNPFLGEKMNGDMAHCRKIRIWPYRIIYQINQKENYIAILEVKHRGSVSYD